MYQPQKISCEHYSPPNQPTKSWYVYQTKKISWERRTPLACHKTRTSPQKPRMCNTLCIRPGKWRDPLCTKRQLQKLGPARKGVVCRIQDSDDGQHCIALAGKLRAMKDSTPALGNHTCVKMVTLLNIIRHSREMIIW